MFLPKIKKLYFMWLWWNRTINLSLIPILVWVWNCYSCLYALCRLLFYALLFFIIILLLL